MEEFITILNDETAEIVEKKSKFIANLIHVESVEEAEDKIKEIKKKYHDARHNCVAYRVSEGGQIVEKSSDDGEPSGTAGKPMMDVLAGSDVTNCLVVVTRYFGGTLLGTGGLVKAYSSASKLALENAQLTDVTAGIVCSIQTDYNSIGKLQYIFASMDIPVLDTLYEENVVFKIVADNRLEGRLEKTLQDEFAGKIQLNKEQNVQFYKSDNSAVIL